MNEQNFKVFGSGELLNECKINIVEFSETGIEKKKTLLYLGRIQNIKAEIEIGVVYRIYVSYKDSIVNILKFDNVMRNANDHINHLYLSKESNSINVLYIGREAEIKSKQGFYKNLVSIEDFYKQESITQDEEKEKVKKLFFDAN